MLIAWISTTGEGVSKWKWRCKSESSNSGRVGGRWRELVCRGNAVYILIVSERRSNNEMRKRLQFQKFGQISARDFAVFPDLKSSNPCSNFKPPPPPVFCPRRVFEVVGIAVWTSPTSHLPIVWSCLLLIQGAINVFGTIGIQLQPAAHSDAVLAIYSLTIHWTSVQPFFSWMEMTSIANVHQLQAAGYRP